MGRSQTARIGHATAKANRVMTEEEISGVHVSSGPAWVHFTYAEVRAHGLSRAMPGTRASW